MGRWERETVLPKEGRVMVDDARLGQPTFLTLCGLVKKTSIQMSMDWVAFLYSLLRSCPDH